MNTPRLDRYDTIVAGSGPAGVMAALHAAERGDVLLVDSSSLPRDKSCGGMLHELTQEFLAPFGEIPERLILSPSHVDFRFVDWDRRIYKPTSLHFINVTRAGFDEWLVSLLPSNVEVVGECGLDSFEQDADGVTVSLKCADGPRSVRCENLVGADGARSTVRRSLGIGSSSSYVTLQDFCELHGELPHYFDCVYMRGIGDSFAYAYVVPKGDTAIVGSVFYPKTKRPWEKQDLALGILRSAMPELGASVKREASCALYVRSLADVAPGRSRVLLAGEAGGFMSPTSGEGISYALHTGRAAGLAIARNRPDAALDAYRADVASVVADIKRRLRWLPIMESPTGKYLAGFVPASIVSRITRGL